jgi:hypothetical protein
MRGHHAVEENTHGQNLNRSGIAERCVIEVEFRGSKIPSQNSGVVVCNSIGQCAFILNRSATQNLDTRFAECEFRTVGNLGGAAAGSAMVADGCKSLLKAKRSSTAAATRFPGCCATWLMYS